MNQKKDDSWLKAAEWRQKNEYWLRVSQDIAIKILSYLRSKNMSQKDLAALLEFSPQHVSKILKGKENLTIESICRIERALQIKLIDTSVFQTTTQYVPAQSGFTGIYSYRKAENLPQKANFVGESEINYVISKNCVA
ncbi:MAG: helix-turn-helix transcriptional regulator [Bacteroidota bacterium]